MWDILLSKAHSLEHILMDIRGRGILYANADTDADVHVFMWSITIIYYNM